MFWISSSHRSLTNDIIPQSPLDDCYADLINVLIQDTRLDDCYADLINVLILYSIL